MAKPQTASYSRILFFILLLTIITPFAFDEYAASLPHMAGSLHSSDAVMQLSITVFVLTLAFSQTAFGIISDHFGRRPTLMVGLVVFLLGSLMCAFAHDATMLLLGRVVQGIGCGLPNVYPPIVIGEAIESNQVPKVTSYYLLGYALIPIISPAIGGYLQHFFGWRANFWFLFIIGLIVFIPSLISLPETHTPTAEDKFSLPNLKRKYKAVLGSWQFMGFSLSALFVWSTVIIFSIVAPFIIQDQLKMSASSYGEMALLAGVGYFIGNLLNTFFVKRELLSQTDILKIGFSIWLIAGACQLLLMVSGIFSIYTFIIPAFIMMIGISMCFPVIIAAALSATEHPGVAGSLLNTVVLSGVAIATALISLLHLRTGTEFAEIFLAFAVMAILMYNVGSASRKRRARD